METYPLVVTVPLPSTRFIYLNVHLDFGFKKTTGWNKDVPGTGDATQGVDTDGNGIKDVIYNAQSYVFSVAGAMEASDGVCPMNVFKKNPGVGGRGGWKYTTFDGVSDVIGMANAKVTLYEKNAVLASGATDEDGWFMLPYKWTGKAATLNVTLWPPGAIKGVTKSITLKANGFVQVDFELP